MLVAMRPPTHREPHPGERTQHDQGLLVTESSNRRRTDVAGDGEVYPGPLCAEIVSKTVPSCSVPVYQQ